MKYYCIVDASIQQVLGIYKNEDSAWDRCADLRQRHSLPEGRLAVWPFFKRHRITRRDLGIKIGDNRHGSKKESSVVAQ